MSYRFFVKSSFFGKESHFILESVTYFCFDFLLFLFVYNFACARLPAPSPTLMIFKLWWEIKYAPIFALSVHYIWRSSLVGKKIKLSQIFWLYKKGKGYLFVLPEWFWLWFYEKSKNLMLRTNYTSYIITF